MPAQSPTIPLDPGEARRPARRSTCCRYTCGALLILLVGALGWGAYEVYHEHGAKLLHSPLRELYYTGDLASANPGDYLKPLIDEHQTFDIAFTVWQRVPGGARTGYTMRMPSGKDMRTDKELVHSSVVFRGLKMGDKHVRTQVSFSVPVAPLRSTAHDPKTAAAALRASFVLIPSGPSPLDHLLRHRAYHDPDTCKGDCLPRSFISRPWPPPEDSPERAKDIRDWAVDTLTCSKPLIVFHPRVGDVSADVTIGSESDYLFNVDSAGEVDDALRARPEFAPSSSNASVASQPYILTRVQLRLIQETHPLNTMPFLRRHGWLAARCGRSMMFARSHTIRSCARSYQTHGNVESYFQLEVPVRDSPSKLEAELVYAPYLDTLRDGYGPNDILPLVSHLNQTNVAREDDYINVTMQLLYRGISAQQARLTDEMTQYFPYSDVEDPSEFNRAQGHDSSELIHGFAGYSWRENQHPRRRVLIDFLKFLLVMSELGLNLLYWSHLETTAGVSVFAAAAAAIVAVAANVIGAIALTHQNQVDNFLDYAFSAVCAALTLPLPLLQIKGALRFRFGWKRWRPTVRQLPATHRERASERLDVNYVSHKLKMLMVILLGCVLFYIPPDDVHVTAQMRRPPGPRTGLFNTVMRLCGALPMSADLVAAVFQLRLNRAQRQFAGMYKLSARVSAELALLTIAERLSAIVGHFDTKDGFTLQAVIELAVCASWVWQAWALPPVPKVVEEED